MMDGKLLQNFLRKPKGRENLAWKEGWQSVESVHQMQNRDDRRTSAYGSKTSGVYKSENFVTG